jgi:hypothetical protein
MPNELCRAPVRSFGLHQPMQSLSGGKLDAVGVTVSTVTRFRRLDPRVNSMVNNRLACPTASTGVLGGSSAPTRVKYGASPSKSGGSWHCRTCYSTSASARCPRPAGELLGSCQFGRCVKVVSRRAAPPCNIAPIGRVSDTAKRLSKYMPLRGLRCASRADTTR